MKRFAHYDMNTIATNRPAKMTTATTTIASTTATTATASKTATTTYVSTSAMATSTKSTGSITTTAFTGSTTAKQVSRANSNTKLLPERTYFPAI